MPRKHTLQRLARLHRPHGASLACAAALLVVTATIPGALVLLVERVLDQVLVQSGEGLVLVPLALVTLYTVKASAGLGRTWLTRRVSLRVEEDLRQQLLEAMLRQEQSWHNQTPLGARLSLLTQDVGQVRYAVSAAVTAARNPLALLLLLLAAWRMDAQLTLAAIIVLPLLVWPTAALGRWLRRAAGASLQGLGDLNARAEQALGQSSAVQAACAEEMEAQRFSAVNKRQTRLQLKALMARLAPGPVVELVAAVGVALAIAVGGPRVMGGEMQAGELVAFLLAVGLMHEPLKGLAEVVSLTQRALAGAERVFAVLDRQPTIQSGAAELTPGPCSVRFDDVSVDYGDGPVVQGVSFTLEAGEQVALVGPSGAGKTSLAALLPRFIDPSQGRVLLNGEDLRGLSLGSLRSAVGWVDQTPALFDATVAENLRLGKPLATEQELEEVCRLAQVWGVIQALPQGLDTPLQRDGARLSGGERQRICIARAMLADPPLLVLDEATSALDREGARAVQQGLAALMKGRTTLVIAHRRDTFERADRVLVLHQGRVVQRGTPAQLAREGGLYAQLIGAEKAGRFSA